MMPRACIRRETMNDETIKIERSPEFIAIAHKVGDHIQSLPLDSAQNDKLIALIIEQVNEGERTAFGRGFGMGVKLGRHLAENAPPVGRVLQ